MGISHYLRLLLLLTMDSNSKRIIPLFEGYCKQTNVDNIDVKCRLGSLPMTLKVASTPESQSMGYQNSETSPTDNQGILFVYPMETKVAFWMKNVNFPLDILFFNANKEMVHRETMQPNTYPKTYHCPILVQYAVETKAGWYDRNGEKDLKLHL